MSKIGTIANSIADEYLLYSGRGIENKSFLTPGEYLLFRSQAMEELKAGMHITDKNSDIASPPSLNTNQNIVSAKTETLVTQQTTTKKELPSNDSSHIKEKDETKEKKSEESMIIPISSATKKQTTSEMEVMLGIMQRIEG